MTTEKQPSETELIAKSTQYCKYCRGIIFVGESYYRAGSHVRHKTCERKIEKPKQPRIAKEGGKAGKRSDDSGRVNRSPRGNG